MSMIVLGGVAVNSLLNHADDAKKKKNSRFTAICFFLLLLRFFFFLLRKRSVSVSSKSSSDNSLDLPKRRKKSGKRKLNEVERLAEMERQRRQKEIEQKVITFKIILIEGSKIYFIHFLL